MTARRGDWSLLDDDPPEELRLDDESASAELPGSSKNRREDRGAESARPIHPGSRRCSPKPRRMPTRSVSTPREQAAQSAACRRSRRCDGDAAAEARASDDRDLERAARGARRHAPPGSTWPASRCSCCVLRRADRPSQSPGTRAESDVRSGTVTKVYGWFGVTLVPRWDLTRVCRQAARRRGRRRRRHAPARAPVACRTRARACSRCRCCASRCRIATATPSRRATSSPANTFRSAPPAQRLLEPDQRIDAELHVIDPGRRPRSASKSTPACARKAAPSAARTTHGNAPRAELASDHVMRIGPYELELERACSRPWRA